METAVETTIRREIQKILLEDGIDDTEYVSLTLLSEIGLDSLGFAILIARLEKGLGFDPFTESGIVEYPQTFGEFLSAYENFRAGQV